MFLQAGGIVLLGEQVAVGDRRRDDHAHPIVVQRVDEVDEATRLTLQTDIELRQVADDYRMKILRNLNVVTRADGLQRISTMIKLQ